MLIVLLLLLLLPAGADEDLLDRRLPATLESGTLGGVKQRLQRYHEILLEAPAELDAVELSDVFPRSYHPTLRELLEALGRDTFTSWSSTGGKVVLSEPAQPLPFTLTLAEGWTSEDRGRSLFTRPEYAPVGMDVYLLGTYSDVDENKIRAEQALKMAHDLRPEATVADMRTVTVDGAEALYYETHPIPNRFWRQWVFFKNHRCYLIISSCEPKIAVRLGREVDQMLASFSAR